MLWKQSILSPPNHLANKLYRTASTIPAKNPEIAKITGIATSAPKASTVPKLNPGVDIDSDESNPMVTNTSIMSPPKEYSIPHIKPTSAIRTAWNIAKENTLILFNFFIIC